MQHSQYYCVTIKITGLLCIENFRVPPAMLPEYKPPYLARLGFLQGARRTPSGSRAIDLSADRRQRC